MRYLQDLVRDMQLHTVTVVRSSEKGTDPLSIVNEALGIRRGANRRRSSQNEQQRFDEVCAVFDGDCLLRGGSEKARFDQAIARSNEESPIEVFVTVPCIEYWFILHLGFTDAPFQDCDEAGKKFGQKMGMDYQKSHPKVFELLKTHDPNGQSQAIQNAQFLRERHPSRFSSPSTEIDRLIKKLEAFQIQ
ncbi:MAG: RloB domain-containing protein [Magnetococcales bacterium]|nr:RloB domain-containing protein [Magnetococcales bacterium]